MDAIIRVIATHGAQSVYAACNASLEGRGNGALISMGLEPQSMSDVIAWHSESYKYLSPANRASDYWEASHAARKL